MKRQPPFWIGIVGALIAIKFVFLSAMHNAPRAARTFKPPAGFLTKTIGGAFRIGEYGGSALRRVSISGGFVPKIRRVRILGVLPDNEQSFRNVFGKGIPYSDARSQELKTTADDLSRLHAYSPFPSIDGEAAIKAAIDATADDQLLIIVGHSTDMGERLALTDGSKIAMDEIQYLATRSSKRCLIVTCHSKDLGLNSAISLAEATKMCEAAVTKVQSSSGAAVDVSDVIREMRIVLEQSRERKIVLTVTGLATGTGSAGVYVTRISNRSFAERNPFSGLPVKTVREHAEAGSPEAQYWLWVLESIANKSSPISIAYLQKSAGQKHPLANYHLARMLIKGEVVKEDMTQAVNCYQIAAEAGLANAQWELGMIYAGGNAVSHNSELAVKWLCAAAKNADAWGWRVQSTRQRILARRFYEGNGVPRDDSQGLYWMLRAAEAGNAFAQFEVAKAYAHGKGVETNLVLAWAWYRTIEGKEKYLLDLEEERVLQAAVSPEQEAAGTQLANIWQNGVTSKVSLR